MQKFVCEREREGERDMANIFDEQQLICLLRLKLINKKNTHTSTFTSI
jgi:hypothetical protein